MKNYFKVASISGSGKRAYGLLGQQADLNEDQQKLVKVGDWIAFRSVERNTMTDADGKIVPCEPYQRQIVSFIGKKDELVSLLAESDILDVEVAAEVASAKKTIAKKFALESVEVAE